MVMDAEPTSTSMDGEDATWQHSEPSSIRLCKVDRNESGSCGFHLTRTKWDPYPWIAGVDEGSPAQAAGLRVGDCLLEVNGEDVLGLKVGQIASKAQASADFVSMLLWNAGSDSKCDSESLCCTPMPTSLSRLSSCLSSILSFLECPICFEIISPPAHQCPFGHLICFRCRVCIERCPVCRTSFTRERSLLADQIYNSIIEAFHLKEHQSTSERTAKLWERVFGRGKKRERERESSRNASHSTCSTPRMSRAHELKNKFLTRLIGKATSVDNLTAETNYTSNNLRKKSISSTDIYPESLKRLNYLHQTHLTMSSSDSSLPNQDGGRLSTYSSATNSCETLASRNLLPYFSGRVRSRNRNLKDSGVGVGGGGGADNLFQFSSSPNTSELPDVADNSARYRYYCPLSQTCTPLTALSLLTHLQQHGGPLVQFFNSRLTINFPFSLENDAIIAVHCYEKTFFLRLLLDEVGDVRLRVWLLGPSHEADEFQFQMDVRGTTDSRGGDLKFTTAVHSIQSTENVNLVYEYRIVIASTTLRNHFQDRPYSLDLHFLKLVDKT